MYQDVIESLESAFADVLPLQGERLTHAKCRELIDLLIGMKPGDLQCFLPQIMMDYLRHPENLDDLEEICNDLNVERVGFMDGLEKEPADVREYFHTAGEEIRKNRVATYSKFTPRHSQGIVIFLEAVRPLFELPSDEQTWLAAHHYWKARS